MIREHGLPCVELSALRMEEVLPMLEALPSLDLARYEYISFHAPSRFAEEDEVWLADLLFARIPRDWPIILHPDSIFDRRLWRRFGRRLAIESMDRRKPSGRNLAELSKVFTELPDASLCFDIGHARQYDSSMTEAYLILSQLSGRLRQVHASEVNSESHHDPISYGAKLAFRQVRTLIPEATPIIIESRVAEAQMAEEVQYVLSCLVSSAAEETTGMAVLV